MDALTDTGAAGTILRPNVAAIGDAADWYKDAIIYQLHVKAFSDSNNDGIGDFAGLTSRLDYLQDLGVTALWLLPFYKSPLRDDGYDIADYKSINPAYGTMADFRRFMAAAKKRNLRVITELVINHTSDQHPWFQRARKAKPGSPWRDWYVWSDSDQRYQGTRIIFTDTEKSNWSWDPEAKAYYWHRFFSHQPDLNFDNPRVFEAIVDIMKFWSDQGVDGFRLDAIPYLVEREGTNNENLPETHAVLKRLRQELDACAPGKLFLAEANQWPEDVSAYFGDGDECHMCYHFPLMPRIYMAIAQEDRYPVTDIMRQTPDIPGNCQWALFLRNHDELTLEMVTDSERDYLWSTYAMDPRARINVGIRRRLTPLMEGDRRKVELMNSLLMSFPGTPIVYYGDEIGMGDNIYLGDRDGVRTPMQWTPDRNGGFSQCNPAQLYLPAVMDPLYGYQAVNVEAQSRSVASFLNWTKRLIGVRRSSACFGRGTLSFLRPENRAVLAYLRQDGDDTILCVANLSHAAQSAEIDLSAFAGRIPLEMLGRTWFAPIGHEPFRVTLTPYGFFWFQLCTERPLSYKPLPLRPDYPTLVWSVRFDSLANPTTRRTLEGEALPGFLKAQRWFADKSARSFSATLKGVLMLREEEPGIAMLVVDTRSTHQSGRYLLPVASIWERPEGAALADVVAAIRRGPREGALQQAVSHPDFVKLMMDTLHGAKVDEMQGMRLAFTASKTFAEEALTTIESVRGVGVEQTNSSIIVDDRFVLKIYRQLVPGLNPEIEIGAHLARRGYANTPEFLGSAELEIDGERHAVAVLHRFVGNQGDGWAYTTAYLDRFLEEQRLLPADTPRDKDVHAIYRARMREIGTRLAQLHSALATSGGDPAFEPQPMAKANLSAENKALQERMERTLDDLERLRASVPDKSRRLLAALVDRRKEALARLRRDLPRQPLPFYTRLHGDFHLGQVMIVRDDVFILDFEGEPRRSLDDRRRPGLALRDVAGLLRSLDYAGLAAIERLSLTLPDAVSESIAAADEWRCAAGSAFVDAYCAGIEGLPIAPQRQTLDTWLWALQIDKALYEVGYELANRPNWLHIPLLGLWQLIFDDEAIPA
ncbi:MAG: maltose alpha-D-glucosyltransferase [Reyranellaceae bacterium]